MVVRDVPRLQWFFSALFAASGLAIGGLSLSNGETGLLMPSAIGVGLGMAIAGLSPMTTSTFDRRMGTYAVRRTGLFGSRAAAGDLRDIVQVFVDEMTSETGYRVALALRSGARIPLAARWLNMRRRSRRVAERIAAFLVATDR